MAMSFSAANRRIDPVCGTCRKKCRKCDRTRPHCMRCISKGLVCEGYPLNIKMYNQPSGPSPKKRSKARQSRANEISSKTVIESTPPLSEANESPGGSATGLEGPMVALKMPQDDPTAEASSPSSISSSIEDHLLKHYENILCTNLSITSIDAPNPFEAYILPLAYQHIGLKKAILGLSACHIAAQDEQAQKSMTTSAIQYRLAAIQSLSSLLLKEECFGLTEFEEEIALAIVLVLVLHDVCDCGKSLHGAHLNGVAFLCSRIASRPHAPGQRQLFLITALTWLDLLRGFSGAEKLAFPQKTRDLVGTADNSMLQSLFGCPAQVFMAIGRTMTSGKKFRFEEINVEEFQTIIDEILVELYEWDPLSYQHPSNNIEWTLLAESYRHVAILRALRFPDTFRIPCSDMRIKTAVESILDASAGIPQDSPHYKRLLFPLFVAGAETATPHQQQYVLFCIRHIEQMTGITYHSLSELLSRTWEDRAKSDGTINVPWFEYTCSKSLTRQHDYLFF